MCPVDNLDPSGSLKNPLAGILAVVRKTTTTAFRYRSVTLTRTDTIQGIPMIELQDKFARLSTKVKMELLRCQNDQFREYMRRYTLQEFEYPWSGEGITPDGTIGLYRPKRHIWMPFFVAGKYDSSNRTDFHRLPMRIQIDLINQGFYDEIESQLKFINEKLNSDAWSAFQRGTNFDPGKWTEELLNQYYLTEIVWSAVTSHHSSIQQDSECDEPEFYDDTVAISVVGDESLDAATLIAKLSDISNKFDVSVLLSLNGVELNLPAN